MSASNAIVIHDQKIDEILRACPPHAAACALFDHYRASNSQDEFVMALAARLAQEVARRKPR